MLSGVDVPYFPLVDDSPTSTNLNLPTPPPSEKDADVEDYPDPVGLSPERW